MLARILDNQAQDRHSLQQGFGEMRRHLECHGQRMDALEGTLDTRFSRMEIRMNDQETAAKKRMDYLEEKLAQLEKDQAEQKHRYTRPDSTMGPATAKDFMLIVGGMPRDSPGDKIEKFIRRVLAQDTVGKLFFGSGEAQASAPPREWRVYSPWFLGSAAFTGCPSERDGRHLLRSLKPFLEKSSFKFSGAAVKLWASVQKPKEERIRNRRLVTLATVLRSGLKEGHFDCAAQPRRMVCWRTATVIVA